MLTVSATAKRLGVAKGTVRQWMTNRRLGFVRLGTRCLRIPVEEIDRMIQTGTVPSRVANQNRTRSAAQGEEESLGGNARDRLEHRNGKLGKTRF